MKTFIGFNEALDLTLASVPICATEILPLSQLTGRILAEDIVAQVDCPSISTSRKDGYAVSSKDLSAASHQNPVKLNLVGSLTAGDSSKLTISSGQMVRVTTGAPLPDGADAVQMVEKTRLTGDEVGALLFPSPAGCAAVTGLEASTPVGELVTHPAVRAKAEEGLKAHNATARGSSETITRALIMREPPSIDANEITDKGYINQRAVLEQRTGLVEQLHAAERDGDEALVVVEG